MRETAQKGPLEENDQRRSHDGQRVQRATMIDFKEIEYFDQTAARSRASSAILG
jgi:hypothetical protein